MSNRFVLVQELSLGVSKQGLGFWDDHATLILKVFAIVAGVWKPNLMRDWDS